ncbi:MAG: hypothetical protein EOM83_11650 [Clostridia bacterium]|nr:hypothetical protein [Clostridia bacterium]
MIKQSTYKILLLTLALIATYTNIQAQVLKDETTQRLVEQVDEQGIFFTDRNIYLSGEPIWISAFVLINNSFAHPATGEVLYVQLIDATGKIISKAKFPVEGNHCQSALIIPEETLSGACALYAYTNYQRNLPADIQFHIPITIVNPDYTLPSSESSVGHSANATAETKTLKVATNKQIYAPREEVQMTIANFGNRLTEVCVAVVPEGTSSNPLPLKNEVKNSGQPEEFFMVPDIRGVSISGQVNNKDDHQPVADAEVYMAVMGADPLLHISKTKAGGVFLFSLDGLSNMRQVFINTKNTAEVPLEIRVNNDFATNLPLPEHAFAIDTSSAELLQQMFINRQVSQVFDANKVASSVPQRNPFPLFGKFDIVVRPDDYISLASLTEVFYEIVPPVSIRSHGNRKSFVVANYTTNEVQPNDLLLLDGVPVFDVEKVLAISPANIESISVINQTYYLGDQRLNNVISIQTKTGDFGGYIFPENAVFLEYQTYSPQILFNAPSYQTDLLKSSTLPDFRTTLLWHPQLLLPADASQKISFYTADNKGTFRVWVRGVAADGTIVATSSVIQVK